MKPYHNVLCCIAATFLLANCSHNPEFRNQIESNNFQANKVEFQEHEKGRYRASNPEQRWWQTLKDNELGQLIHHAFKHNYDIRIALSNVAAARALVSESKLDRYPTIQANAGSARQRLSDEGVNGINAERNFSTYDAGFDAVWELDLFGRVNSGISASSANLEARRADAQAMHVTVAAEVAKNYIELRGAQLQLNVAEKNAKNQRTTLKLTNELLTAGRGSTLDVERAKSQVLFTESQIPSLQAAINASINRLEVLTGQPPDTLRELLKQSKDLPSIPITVAVGDAPSLLARRPDVRAAEHELASSIAEYDIEVANLYPRFTLEGSIGFLSTSFSNTFTGGASNFIFGPRISWAAFDLGRVKSRIKASDAKAQADLSRFEKTVRVALEEVDTGMVNFSHEEKRRAKLAAAANASAKASILARQRYDAGSDNFLDLLDSERSLLDAQSQLATSETKVLLDLVALYKALGGGWQITQNTK
ncbi:efflux transporter outer membrane subunit [Marinibactrum halimedae]|uniref:RND transporter n=1 Tax=Marinibactrum halimedae TaxID=1444977 RepID=A0AA37T886_9GAMM|nr:TolC family protein [Marinibactrum halimedae]MCD9459443.1 TolC family protein [Marinibactrum halimedae]GLS27489.1 RND transporter [Marinibactrum halimedae]